MQFDYREFHVDASPLDEGGRLLRPRKDLPARIGGRRCRRSEVFG